MKRTLLLVLLSALVAPAQTVKPSLTGCHAIVGATVLASPDRRLEKATLVLRDGLIVALGADVPVPGDADVIDGAGLTLVAGFTLFGGSVAPAKSDSAEPPPTPDPNRQPDLETMGLTPATDAARLFQENPVAAKDWIAAGVTTLVIAPKGRAAAGHAAIVDNRLDLPPAERLRRAQTAQVMGFRRAARGYPASTMGIVAALRQMLLDARHLKSWRQRFASRPQGTPVPPERRALQALFAALDGKEPVLFATRRAGDVRRAADLARAFGLRAWIRGGQSLVKALPMLEASGAAAILDLDPGKLVYRENRERLEPPKPKKDEGTEKKPEVPGETKAETPTAAKQEEKKKEPEEKVSAFVAARRNAARNRELEDLERLLAAGPKLGEHGIPFSIALEKPGELLKLVRAHVRAGLPRRDALAALTITPSRLLGLEKSQGRLAPGGVADIVLFRGDPFEDGKVAHVFCRGQRIDVSKKKEEKTSREADGKAATLADLAGDWIMESEGRDETRPITLTLKDGKLSGALKLSMGEARITDVALEGRNVTMSVAASFGGQEMNASFTGDLSGDGKEMSGTMDWGGRFQQESTFKRKPKEMP